MVTDKIDVTAFMVWFTPLDRSKQRYKKEKQMLLSHRVYPVRYYER
jgi:hypothetical protein